MDTQIAKLPTIEGFIQFVLFIICDFRHILNEIKKNYHFIPYRSDQILLESLAKIDLPRSVKSDSDILSRLYSEILLRNGTEEKKRENIQKYTKYLYLVCLKCISFIERLNRIIDRHSVKVINQILTITTEDMIISCASEHLSRELISTESEIASYTKFDILLQQLRIGNTTSMPKNEALSMLRSVIKTSIFFPRIKERYEQIHKTLYGDPNKFYGLVNKSLSAFRRHIESIKDILTEEDNQLEEIDADDDEFVIDDENEGEIIIRGEIIKIKLTEKILEDFELLFRNFLNI